MICVVASGRLDAVPDEVLAAFGIPAVIDFSLLERPAGLPLAIVAVDALQWCQALPATLDQLAGQPEIDQLLARALIYRHVTEIIRHAGTPGIDTVARAGKPVTDLILARLAGLRLRPDASNAVSHRCPRIRPARYVSWRDDRTGVAG